MITFLRIDRLLVFLLLGLCASTTQAQWQKPAAPIETHVVPADGSRVPFSLTLPNSMQYWVRTSGTVVMSTTNDRADAHYYNTTPTALGYAGFMVRANGTSDVLMQVASPQSYRADHIYIDPIASTGKPLSFKLSDENPFNPGTNYYLDNSGELNVEVAQGSPEIYVKFDTLDFGTMNVGDTKMMLDSMQSWGKFPLQVRNMQIEPITGGNAFTFYTQIGSTFDLQEGLLDINVTVKPTTRGALLARLHIPSNAYNAPDKIIILKANVLAADVIMVGNNDTLDFGIVAAGTTTTKGRFFYNQGNVSTSITGVTISTPAIFSAATPLQLPPAVQASLDFTFTPPAQGNYFATADVQYAYGGTKRMYLKGRAGVGIPKLSTHLIDFGRVKIGSDSTIALELSNIGDVEYILLNAAIDNTQFSFTGVAKFLKIGQNGKMIYQVTFKPTFHLDPYHEGHMVFKFDNGIEETVILRGRDDAPLGALLRIDTNYFARQNEEVVVTQRLIAELELTKSPIRKFTEFVQFDKDILEFIRVEKADLIASDDWVLKTSQIGGAIDIAISSATARLGGPGKLFKFIFRVRENVPDGIVTAITQVTPNFYNTIEPLAQVSDGAIHILDRCDPIIVAGIARDTGSYIGQNQPNPFNPSTEIGYYLGHEGPVRIDLYSATGEHVSTLLDEVRPEGLQHISFDGSSLPSGVYTYVFTANGKREVKRMLLVK